VKLFHVLAMSTVLVVAATGCTVRAEGRNAHHGARTTPAAADSPRSNEYESLGERWVTGKNDRDSIHAGRQGRFHQIMIVVDESALEMNNVVVHFGDGTSYSPNTRLVFDRSSRSRVIDLPGDARIVKRVDFRYGNLPGGGRAHVKVFGR
jgi:hypothetical protein